MGKFSAWQRTKATRILLDIGTILLVAVKKKTDYGNENIVHSERAQSSGASFFPPNDFWIFNLEGFPRRCKCFVNG